MRHPRPFRPRHAAARRRDVQFRPLTSALEPRTMLDGAIDPSFGQGGLVTTPLAGDRPARVPLAVLADGSFLVAGQGSSDGGAALARYLPSGAPDPSFGSGGVLKIVDPYFSTTYVAAIAVHDGRVVVAERGVGSGGAGSMFILAEFTTDGAPVRTFGTGGEELIDPHSILAAASSADGSITSVAFQSDGKLLIGGTIHPVSGGSNGPGSYFVARYGADSQPDTTFGTFGAVVGQAAPRASTTLTALAVQPDDRVVVTAEAAGAPLLLRFNTSGTPDGAFGSGGKVSLPFRVDSLQVERSLALQADGKILVSGFAAGAAPRRSPATRPRAPPDTSFGTGGVVTGATYGHNSRATATVAVEPDQKVLVAAGGTLPGSTTRDDFLLTRYTPAGAVDPTFGTGGVAAVDIAGAVPDYARDDYPTALAIQSGNRIVLAGTTGFYSTPTVALARFLADGTGEIPPPTGSPRLAPGQDGGASPDDGLLNVNQGLQFVGVSPNIGGGMVQLLRDNVVVDTEPAGSALVDGGTIPDGRHNYTARQVNAFGRAGAQTSPLVITIDTVAPAMPPAPTLDSTTDTGVQGDGVTKNRHPRLDGTAEPGSTVQILAGSNVLGTARAGPGGSYAVDIAAPLPFGAIVVHATATDAAGNVGAASDPFTLRIIAAISPVLIVSVHGQEADFSGLANQVKGAFGAVASAVGLGNALTYDIAGAPLNGSGRHRDPWQDVIGNQFYQAIAQKLGDQAVAVKSLIVEWDTYGMEGKPAQATADRINQIVADTSYGGEPWDVLLVGYSRGGPFVNDVAKDLNLAQNARIDYSEAVLLDPTASKVSGDQFPAAVPVGLKRMIDYDDGYDFPGTKLQFKLLGKTFNPVNLTVDGNSARIAGAEYRYVRPDVEGYLRALNPPKSLNAANSHSAVPYWYLQSSATNGAIADLDQFLANKDGGLTGKAGSRLVHLPDEIFRPPSEAPSYGDTVKGVVAQLKKILNDAVASAQRLAGQIAKEVGKVVDAIAVDAKKAADALIRAAATQGKEVLDEARRKGAAILKAADAEIKQIQAGARRTADQLAREGKLFGAAAQKQVARTLADLASVKAKGGAVVAKAQKDANQAVADVKKKVGVAKHNAEVAARRAADRLVAARAQAEREAQKAAAQVAAAAAAARDAAAQEAARLAQQARDAANAVSSGLKKLRKKFHF